MVDEQYILNLRSIRFKKNPLLVLVLCAKQSTQLPNLPSLESKLHVQDGRQPFGATQAQPFPMPHPWVNYCHFTPDYVDNSALEPPTAFPSS